MEQFGTSMSLSEHMIRLFTTMDGKDATSHGSSSIGLERFETDHEIVQELSVW